METQAEILKRWRDLREMLIQQLSMFQSGALVLRSNGVNISPETIEELEAKILEFDKLIAEDAGGRSHS